MGGPRQRDELGPDRVTPRSDLSLPWPMRRPGDPVMVLAHRGGTGTWRENSLEAFSAALHLGADGVELDVRRSIDGTLVVHHDAEVPGAGRIDQCPIDSLPAWVPTLNAALETCTGSVVNVEIKNLPTDPAYDPDHRLSTDLAGLLVERGAHRAWPAHIVVSSFWPENLAAVRQARCSTPLGLLVHPALDVGTALDTALSLQCVALHPHHSQVSAELVSRAHRLGLAVVTWTVNTLEEIDAVVDAGVDIVITDSVADTLAHLGRR